MPCSREDGYVVVEEMNFYGAEGQVPHGFAGRVGPLVAGEELGSAVGDLLADEDAIGRIGVDQSRNVAAVPGFELGIEDGLDFGFGVAGLQWRGSYERGEQCNEGENAHWGYVTAGGYQ